MKKLGARLAVLGVFLLIAVGCNSSSDEGKSTSGAKYNTRATEALVLQVQVGMTEKEVRDLLGEPLWNEPGAVPSERGWVYVYDGGKREAIIAFRDGKVGRSPILHDVIIR